MNPFTVIAKLGKLHSLHVALSCINDDLATDASGFIAMVFASLQFPRVVECTAERACLGSEI